MKKEAELDVPLLLRYLGGGALVGGGMGAVYSYLKDLNRMVDESDLLGKPTDEDDNMVYVKTKPEEEGGVEKVAQSEGDPSEIETWNDDSVNTFLKWTGAVGGGVLGYMGVKELYDKIRKQSLQEEMDRSQVAYIEGLSAKREEERKKYASLIKEANPGDRSASGMGGAGVMSILALLALASGVMTNKALDKAYPSMKKENPKNKPGGRRLTRAPVEEKADPYYPTEVNIQDGGEDEVIKTDATEDSAAEEIEHLIRTTAADDEVKEAAAFDDLLAALAQGKGELIKSAVREFGINHAFTVVKGAAFEKTSSLKKELAIGFLASDPLLKEAFVPLFASEFYNMSPHMCHAARSLSEETQDTLCKMAATFNSVYRATAFRGSKYMSGSYHEKTASLLDVTDGLRAALEDDDDEEELDEGSSFSFKGESSEDSQGTDDQGENIEEDPDQMSGDDDPVDEVFQSSSLKPAGQ